MKEDTEHIKNQHSEPYLAKWMAGEISDSNLIELIGKEEFKVYAKILKGIEVEKQLDEPISNSRDVLLHKISERKETKTFNFRKLGMVASLVGVAFIIFQTFFNTNDNSSLVTHHATFGTQNKINLLDNSEVTLNSNSVLTYHSSHWENNRSLELNGEAYFKVAKGKTFTVNTPNGKIQVLGTQFNVISNSNYFSVVCYEGKVSVKANGEEYILTKNKALSNINGVIKKSITMKNRPSWLNGESSFDSAPLDYVLRAIENQYNVDFSYNNLDPSFVFTGIFPHNNLEIALQTVLTSFNINYKKTNQNTIILTSGE